MHIGVAGEDSPGERRVALTPEGVKALKSKGFEVTIEPGAGSRAGFSDLAYGESGATLGDPFSADLMARVTSPTHEAVRRLKKGQILLSMGNPELAEALRDQGVTSFWMELIPRITRAQSMDVLSSMSTIAGYKGSLLAASLLPKFFPMFMTAAGTIPAARVLVIGAGVAGLQAIATCRRLGAIVEAFDVRPAVKEQVESLGAKFVEMAHHLDDAEDASGYAKEVSGTTLTHELELIASRLAKCDVVISTALIPGKRAPTLITREMLKLMHPGSVVVDLAAPNGGNCEGTVPGQTVTVEGVTVAGPTNLLSEMAYDASRMYSKNVVEFLMNLAPEGALNLNLEDQIIRETLVTHEGKITHDATRLRVEREVKP